MKKIKFWRLSVKGERLFDLFDRFSQNRVNFHKLIDLKKIFAIIISRT